MTVKIATRNGIERFNITIHKNIIVRNSIFAKHLLHRCDSMSACRFYFTEIASSHPIHAGNDPQIKNSYHHTLNSSNNLAAMKPVL